MFVFLKYGLVSLLFHCTVGMYGRSNLMGR